MKFKTGDLIVPIGNDNTFHRRVVIGYTHNGNVVYDRWNAQGQYRGISDANPDSYKLAPQKREGWMNVWAPSQQALAALRGCIAYGTYIYATKEEAENAATYSSAPLDTVKVEWEE